MRRAHWGAGRQDRRADPAPGRSEKKGTSGYGSSGPTMSSVPTCTNDWESRTFGTTSRPYFTLHRRPTWGRQSHGHTMQGIGHQASRPADDDTSRIG